MTHMDHIGLCLNICRFHITLRRFEYWLSRALASEGDCHELCQQGKRCYYTRGVMVGKYLVGYPRSRA